MKSPLQEGLYASADFLTVASASKMSPLRHQFVEKHSVSGTIVFADPKPTSAPKTGDLKGVQTMDSPKLCVPLFLSSRGSRKQGFCRADVVRTTIFVEPESCVPLFLSSRLRAYRYFCRAGMLHVLIL